MRDSVESVAVASEYKYTPSC